MELNTKLLDETLEFIKTHPQEWEQKVWFGWYKDGVLTYDEITVEMIEQNSCQSGMCFAGHAALRAGFPAPPKNNDDLWTDGEGQHVSDFAREKLGLTLGQASALFDGENSLEDLERMVEAIKANPNVSEDALWDLRDRPKNDYEEEEEEDAEPCDCEFCRVW